MTKVNKYKSLEDSILVLKQKTKKTLSIEEILNILSGKGRALILILLSLPFCQPIQIPGLSIPFGLAIAFIALRMAFGKNIWLPKKVLSKKISSHILQKITDKVLLVLRKIKHLIHPRLNWISDSSFMKIINCLIVFVLGIFLALPLPIPFTNLAAAWAILLISIGILEDDGLFILIGYFVFLMTIALFIILGFFIKHIF